MLGFMLSSYPEMYLTVSCLSTILDALAVKITVVYVLGFFKYYNNYNEVCQDTYSLQDGEIMNANYDLEHSERHDCLNTFPHTFSNKTRSSAL